jgi:poly(3-hydroxybutyrate) depolymerase
MEKETRLREGAAVTGPGNSALRRKMMDASSLHHRLRKKMMETSSLHLRLLFPATVGSSSPSPALFVFHGTQGSQTHIYLAQTRVDLP